MFFGMEIGIWLVCRVLWNERFFCVRSAWQVEKWFIVTKYSMTTTLCNFLVEINEDKILSYLFKLKNNELEGKMRYQLI